MKPFIFNYIQSIKQFIMLFLIAISAVLPAQELKIMQTDTAAFPQIKLLISFKGNQKLEKENISLIQEGSPIDFTLEPANPNAKSNSGRAIYFLVESSGNTFGKGITDIKSGLMTAIDNLKKTDVANVGYFGSKQVDSIGLRLANNRYIADGAVLKQKIASNIAPQSDSLKRSDLYASILDALISMENEPELPLQKMLIVLSASRNNSKMSVTSSECISKAKELKIPIYSINYIDADSAYNSGMMGRISRQTSGKNVSASSSMEIANAITDFINDPSVPTVFDGLYDLLFNVKISSGMTKAKVELVFNNTRQILSLSSPDQGLTLPEDYQFYLILSIGILALILLIMVLVNYLSKRKPKRNESDEETEETPTESPKYYTKTTELVSSAPKNFVQIEPGTPILLTNFNGRTETFPLGEEVNIGRHDSNDIQLNVPTVTGKHAIIRTEDKILTIIDLGSTNGTYVNGEKVKQKVLKSGDKIKLGEVELVLKT